MQYNSFSPALKTIARLPKSALWSHLGISKARLVSEKIGLKYREMKIAELKKERYPKQKGAPNWNNGSDIFQQAGGSCRLQVLKEPAEGGQKDPTAITLRYRHQQVSN